MDLVLSHQTAFLFWRRFSGDRASLPVARTRTGSPQRIPRVSGYREQLAALGIPSTPQDPVHLLFFGQKPRNRDRFVHAHSHSTPLPKGSLLRIAPDVLVVSPELCFAQMCEVLPQPKAILAGFELCGTYAIDDGLVERPPLTSVEQLRRYLPAVTGRRSAAQRALTWVLDGAASPMEARLAMLLTLPRRLGGMGLPRPILNRTIPLSADARRVYPHATCRCDLFWESARFAVEYEGRVHEGEQPHAKSVARAAALRRMGITALHLTYQQVADSKAFQVAADTIAQELGARLRVAETLGFGEKAAGLRAHLGVRDQRVA